jgi:site-specific recombinase XerD
MMLEELQRRNYSQATVRAYLLAVRQFAEYFHQSPDQLGPDHIRRFQSYLLQEKKLSPRTVVQRVSALRFLFVKTLKRHYMPEHLPFPKAVRRLPIVLSQEKAGSSIQPATCCTGRC